MAKIKRLGLMDDRCHGGKVFEVEIEIEGKTFGARTVVSHYAYTNRPDPGLIDAIKEDLKERLGREIMHTLFPNL